MKAIIIAHGGGSAVLQSNSYGAAGLTPRPYWASLAPTELYTQQWHICGTKSMRQVSAVENIAGGQSWEPREDNMAELRTMPSIIV